MDDSSQPMALVTGAARGLGLEVARQLAQQGMAVLLTARNAAQGLAAAQRLAAEGLSVQHAALDVADPASIQQLAASLGRLDILINNAAALANWTETATTADLAATHVLFETNLFGPWRMAQAMLPLLRASKHGRIVNVSSGGGSHGDALFPLTANGGTAASYGVSKAALNALTAKLAAELAASPIIVNAVCPGFTASSPGMAEMGARPVAESARGVVWAATLPDDGPRGGFFRDGLPIPW